MLEHQQSVDETLANSRPVPPIRRAKSADGKGKSAVVKSKIHLCIHGSWKTIMIIHYDYTFIYIYSAMRKSKYKTLTIVSSIVMCDSYFVSLSRYYSV